MMYVYVYAHEIVWDMSRGNPGNKGQPLKRHPARFQLQTICHLSEAEAKKKATSRLPTQMKRSWVIRAVNPDNPRGPCSPIQAGPTQWRMWKMPGVLIGFGFLLEDPGMLRYRDINTIALNVLWL